MSKAKWLIVLLILLPVLWFLGQKISSKYLPEIKKGAENFFVEEVKPVVTSPEPLRVLRDELRSFLTVEGVIQATNAERSANGLVSLKTNTVLNAAALAKVNDMFAGQYFAHVSPEGKDATHFTNGGGYKAIAIGENLAMGNFRDDEDLVKAWMESPGHRANILNSQYEEIGVAVKKEMFEGKTVWLAVQMFGRPLSSCPQPDSSLKLLFETEEQELQALEQQIATKRAEIDQMSPKDPQYNAKVEEYNSLVRSYNSKLESLKKLINNYNAQVRATNECIGA